MVFHEKEDLWVRNGLDVGEGPAGLGCRNTGSGVRWEDLTRDCFCVRSRRVGLHLSLVLGGAEEDGPVKGLCIGDQDGLGLVQE